LLRQRSDFNSPYLMFLSTFHKKMVVFPWINFPSEVGRRPSQGIGLEKKKNSWKTQFLYPCKSKTKSNFLPIFFGCQDNFNLHACYIPNVYSFKIESEVSLLYKFFPKDSLKNEKCLKMEFQKIRIQDQTLRLSSCMNSFSGKTILGVKDT
jgi:hypothetical protein